MGFFTLDLLSIDWQTISDWKMGYWIWTMIAPLIFWSLFRR